MNTNQEFCERCGEPLKADRIVWLELSITDGRYYRKLPANHESQGGFPFGQDCARSESTQEPGQ